MGEDVTKKRPKTYDTVHLRRGPKAFPTLKERCLKLLQAHVDDLRYVGDVPDDLMCEILKPASASTLEIVEESNSGRDFGTNELWKKLCLKDFGKRSLVDETQDGVDWRARYRACKAEEAEKQRKFSERARKLREDEERKRKEKSLVMITPEEAAPKRRKSTLKGAHGFTSQGMRKVMAMKGSTSNAPPKSKIVLTGSTVGPSRPAASSAAGRPQATSVDIFAPSPKKALKRSAASLSTSKANPSPSGRAVPADDQRGSKSGSLQPPPNSSSGSKLNSRKSTPSSTLSSECKACAAAVVAGYKKCAAHKAQQECKKCEAARQAGYLVCADHKVAPGIDPSGTRRAGAGQPPPKKSGSVAPGPSKNGTPAAARSGAGSKVAGAPAAPPRPKEARSCDIFAAKGRSTTKNRTVPGPARSAGLVPSSAKNITRPAIQKCAEAASARAKAGARELTRGHVEGSKVLKPPLKKAAVSSNKPIPRKVKKAPRPGSRKELDPFWTSSDDDEENPSAIIGKMFGYDPSRFADEDDRDLDSMEVASFRAHEALETQSLKVGRKEDLEEERRQTAENAKRKRKRGMS